MRAQKLIGPAQFETVDVEPPKAEDLEPDQALIATLATSVCGSDIPLFRGQAMSDTVNYTDEVRFGPRRPGFPCHEVIGTVIATKGPLKVGDRVVGWAFRNSGMADTIIVEATSVVVVPDDFNPVQQLTIQPLACIFHALGRVGPIAGKRTAVVGQGPIGLLFSEILKYRGAAHVAGVDRADRANGGHDFGVDDKVVEASDRWAYQSQTRGLYDIVIEAIGHHHAPLNHCIDAAANEGVVFGFGGMDEQHYSIEIRQIHRKNLSLLSGGTPLHRRPKALQQAADYVAANPDLMKAFVTDVFRPEESQQAFLAAAAPAEGRIKVALNWND